MSDRHGPDEPGPGEPGLGWPARLALWLGTHMAPPRHRERWRREWQAELMNRPDAQSGWQAILGAWADARSLHHLDGPRPGEMTTTMSVIQTMKEAWRGLARAPGTTLPAVLTLGLGIGAAGAIFVLLQKVVLSPLPFPESHRLVQLRNDVPCVGEGTRWDLATAQIAHYRQEPTSLAGLAAFQRSGTNLLTADGPVRASQVSVSEGALEVLGARTEVGRLFSAGDYRLDGAPVALISHEFWVRALGADPAIVGTDLRLGTEVVTVVGVLAPGVTLPDPLGLTTRGPADVWSPLRLDPAQFVNSHVYPTVAVLAEGASVASAQAEMDRLRPGLPTAFPEVYSEGFIHECGFRTVVLPLEEQLLGDLSRNLWLLFGAVLLVLAVACANVANLVLVRREARAREMAVRRALGADTGALRGLLVGEAALLAVAGAALGTLVAWWGVPVLLRLVPDGLPGLAGIRPGPTLPLFTLGLAALLVPALALLGGARTPVSEGGAPRGSGVRGGTADVGTRRVREGLVVVQVATALTLVVGAALLLESMVRLQSVEPGFRDDGVLVVSLHPTQGNYTSMTALWTALNEIREEVEALPGIATAGLGSDLPLTGGFGCTVQGFADASVRERITGSGGTTCAGQTVVGPGYFEALDIPVVEGRTLTRSDLDTPETGAVVVSRTFADRFWPDGNALGQEVGPGGQDEGPWYRVVGIVDDIPRATLDGERANAIYYPLVPRPGARSAWFTTLDLVVASEAGLAPLDLATVRRIVASVDPTMAVANPRLMEDQVEASMARLTFSGVLLQTAALMALLLAAVGLYSVVSWLVGRRTREIGTRMALGADPGGVVRMVLQRTALLALAGVAVGVVASLGLGGVLESLLYGVTPSRPVTLVGAGLLLTLVTLAAAWLPARRAARVDPVEALRAE